MICMIAAFLGLLWAVSWVSASSLFDHPIRIYDNLSVSVQLDNHTRKTALRLAPLADQRTDSDLSESGVAEEPEGREDPTKSKSGSVAESVVPALRR